jgi:alkanesulfonate monooxygenase SsuD/methylene tetrahydromethanopterin reductase-like flavin-dependent oxidoreductase (luciferase family)
VKCFRCRGAIHRTLPDEARRTIIAGTSSEEIKKQIPEFIDDGITHFIFTVWSQPYDRESLRRFAQAVIPAFR